MLFMTCRYTVYKVDSKNNKGTLVSRDDIEEKMKKEIILNNMKLSIKLFSKIYKTFRRQISQRTFFRWKLKAKMLKNLKILEPEIKKEFMTHFEIKKKDLNIQINLKEKNLNKIREDIRVLKDKISEEVILYNKIGYYVGKSQISIPHFEQTFAIVGNLSFELSVLIAFAFK